MKLAVAVFTIGEGVALTGDHPWFFQTPAGDKLGSCEMTPVAQGFPSQAVVDFVLSYPSAAFVPDEFASQLNVFPISGATFGVLTVLGDAVASDVSPGIELMTNVPVQPVYQRVLKANYENVDVNALVSASIGNALAAAVTAGLI